MLKTRFTRTLDLDGTIFELGFEVMQGDGIFVFGSELGAIELSPEAAAAASSDAMSFAQKVLGPRSSWPRTLGAKVEITFDVHELGGMSLTFEADGTSELKRESFFVVGSDGKAKLATAAAPAFSGVPVEAWVRMLDAYATLIASIPQE